MSAKKAMAAQYTKLPADLIRSPVLRNLPQCALCVVLPVLDELDRHGGKDNGNQIVPYRMAQDLAGHI
jgi:hypothetical protein